MSEILATTTSLTSIDDDKIAAIRQAIIGNKVTIPQSAKAFDVTDRAIYYAVKRNPVPYIQVLGVRYYEPEDLARALVTEKNTASRGRGRPRSA